MNPPMLNRRHLLFAVAATALTQPVSSLAATSSAKAKLDTLLAVFIEEEMDRSPELVTTLGLDGGARAGAKAALDDRSLAARARDKADNLGRLKRLHAIDRTALTGEDAVNYDTIAFVMQNQADYDRQFAFGNGPGDPFVITQQDGAYQGLPDFLDSQHTIETTADAEAYLSRLAAFAVAMDQEAGKARHDAGLGVVPPDFILDKTLIQLNDLRATPAATAPLVQSLARRAKEKGLAGDWAARASAIYTDKVLPALDRQVALMNELKTKASHASGASVLPNGAAFYAVSLEAMTTTELTPDEIHKLGVDLVASLSSELDTRLKAQGLADGTVGARLRILYDDPKYRYPDTDAGKDTLLADLNAKVAVIQAKLPVWFKTLPKTTVAIRRVPAYIEAGAAGGYYQPGTLDGSRPGAYYINLRDTAEVPSWSLPTLTYHEAIPGHHLQLSLQQEAGLPLIRKVVWFAAYGEGWALYAEQLAEEMGMYETDPMGRIGYLHDALFRALRLVVDTGLHQQRWTREQAIKYYVETLGDQEAGAVTEVERYCVSPGQACSYMIGKLTWLRLRERAKTALGPKFDIREFHDAGLLPGPTPLTVLDRVIADYTKAKLA
jgi:uncharacterized protein (DUF885 family)